MSKFDSLRARVLYSRASTDEEVGSTDGMGWAGLYMNWDSKGGHILTECTQGFVKIQECETDQRLTEVWGETCDNLEVSGDPEDDEWIIMVNARTNEFYCMDLGESVMFDSMQSIIVGLMTEFGEERKIWYENERANFIPVDVQDYI